MKKKISAIMMSALAFISASSVQADAIFTLTKNDEALIESGYVRIESAEAYSVSDEKAILYLGANARDLKVYEKGDDFVDIYLPVGTDTESLAAKIAEIAPDTVSRTHDNKENELIVVSNVSGAAQVKDICGLINEETEILRSSYYADVYYQTWLDFSLGYTPFIVDEETLPVLTEYVENNLPGWTVEKGAAQIVKDKSIYDVNAPEGTANIEKFNTANQIARDTGLSVICTALASEGGIQDMIDASDYVSGDANSDTSANIADAVAVLQYLANEEKYPLTPQGIFNADVDGSDGLTGADATVIQMIDAGIF
ncbi:MAG: hypothetical protein IJ874_01565 [Ruminococcus sp.]|nr:hypothetical protein [Ruminococcus sp.]